MNENRPNNVSRNDSLTDSGGIFSGQEVSDIDETNLKRPVHVVDSSTNKVEYDSYPRVIRNVQLDNTDTADPFHGDNSVDDGIVGEIKKTLLGGGKKLPPRKSKDHDPPIHVHIDAIYVNTQRREERPYGVYGDPYYGSPPPEPCGPRAGYHFLSDIGRVNPASPDGFLLRPREPVEQGLSAPTMTSQFDGFLNPNMADVPVPHQRAMYTVQEDLTEKVSPRESSVPHESTISGYAKISKSMSAMPRSDTEDNHHQHHPQLDTVTEYKTKDDAFSPIIHISSSSPNLEGIPEAFDVCMRLKGSNNALWSGQLKCLPEEVKDNKDKRRPQSMFVSAKQVEAFNPGFSEERGRQQSNIRDPTYVNWSKPFTGDDPYRVGSAGGDETHDDKAGRTVSMQDGRVWQSMSNIVSASQDKGKRNKPVPNRHLPVLSTKKSAASCQRLRCVSDGLHADIHDDNEKAHIKECLLRTGKLGHWAILPLQDHPLHHFILEVRCDYSVSSFPVGKSRKGNYKIDPTKKGFKCLCELIKHYKTNKLPRLNYNLGQAFPKSQIPPTDSEADTTADVKRQYAGVRL